MMHGVRVRRSTIWESWTSWIEFCFCICPFSGSANYFQRIGDPYSLSQTYTLLGSALVRQDWNMKPGTRILKGLKQPGKLFPGPICWNLWWD